MTLCPRCGQPHFEEVPLRSWRVVKVPGSPGHMVYFDDRYEIVTLRALTDSERIHYSGSSYKSASDGQTSQEKESQQTVFPWEERPSAVEGVPSAGETAREGIPGSPPLDQRSVAQAEPMTEDSSDGQ